MVQGSRDCKGYGNLPLREFFGKKFHMGTSLRENVTKYFTVIQRNRDANKLFFNWYSTTDEMRIIQRNQETKFYNFPFSFEKRGLPKLGSGGARSRLIIRTARSYQGTQALVGLSLI